MKYLPRNTLAYFQAAPQYAMHKLGALPVSSMSKGTALYRTNCGMVVPDGEALSFYGLNHCASIVKSTFTPNEPLPKWALDVMNAYLCETVRQVERLSHYMISITVREARHWHGPTEALSNKMKELYGEVAYNFFANGHDGEVQAVDRYMNHPPECTLEQFVGALVHLFDHGKWSGGYGGKPWGQIARTLLMALTGKTTFEVMADTAYTLAHNNGPMFNKGMMYKHHTGEFLMILDIQRSGQIPELFLGDEAHVTDAQLDPVVEKIIQAVQDEKQCFGKYVDWFKVKELGALHAYPSQEAAQKKKYGAVAVDKFMGKPAKSLGMFEVYPDETVQVYERIHA